MIPKRRFFMKKIISLCLLLTVFSSALLLPSCDTPDEGNVENKNTSHDLYPKGYTGGFTHQPGANIEYWWVETYEECLEAIELLKSHGSTFKNDTVLTYDGNLFDCKYCFKITGATGIGLTEKIEWGDNPFDRRAIDVSLTCYAFFDDVTIDELNHSYVDRYEAYLIYSEKAHSMFFDEITAENITISEWTKKGYENSYKEGHYKFNKIIYYGDQEIISMGTMFYVKEGTEHEFGMTDDCIKALITSGKIIYLKL